MSYYRGYRRYPMYVRRPPSILVIGAILSLIFNVWISDKETKKAAAIQAAKPIDWSNPYELWRAPTQDWPACAGKPGCTK